MTTTQIVLFASGYVPQAGDVGIELKQRRGLEMPALHIDPQHGGHCPAMTVIRTADGQVLDPARWAALVEEERTAMAEEGLDVGPVPLDPEEGLIHAALRLGDGTVSASDWPAPKPGACAASFAAELMDSGWRMPDGGRVVLGPGAGLDDFAAAALLVHFPRLDELEGGYWSRMHALRDADNAGEGDRGPWTPGKRAWAGVNEMFSGLGRLCATEAIPLADRVAMVGRWLRAGVLDWGYDYLPALGVEPLPSPQTDFLPALDAVARERRAAYVARCQVEVTEVDPRDAAAALLRQLAGRLEMEFGGGGEFWAQVEVADVIRRLRPPGGPSLAVVESPAPSGDPSEGQGGPALGYESAPFVVAWYPLPPLRIAVTADFERDQALARRKYTIGRHSGAPCDWDFAGMMARLNEAEQAECARLGVPVKGTWGGNPASGVGGSPGGIDPAAGSYLAPETVREIVLTAIGGGA